MADWRWQLREKDQIEFMKTAALGPMTVISMEGEASSSSERIFRGLWRGAIAVLIALLIGLAWLVRVGALYEAGSDFGYYLGLVGGLLMASLLLYPLRKRFVHSERLGKMSGWFKYHMIAGILGPTLVLFHTTFRTGSMNGATALYAMLLVAASGVVGRFLYRHIHKGLYGQHLTLADVSAELKNCSDSLGSVFALQPDIEPRLREFHEKAFLTEGSLPTRIWRFLTLRFRGRQLAARIRHDAKRALRQRWRETKVPKQELYLSYQLAKGQINRYVDAVIKASQLAAWERLFSWWHIVHIPFLYLLVFSGVVHVIAVHMY